jgi:integrase
MSDSDSKKQWGKSLNAQAFKNVKPEETEFFQRAGEIPGLFLRVRPSKTMSWVFRYRIFGKPDKLTLGPADPSGRKGLTLKEARDIAGNHRKLVGLGKNPRLEIAKQFKQAEVRARTFSDVFDDLYAGGTHGEIRPQESINIFDRDLRESLSRVPIADFGPEHFAKAVSGTSWWHPDGTLKHGKIAAAYRLIKKTVRHAISRGWLTNDPLRNSPGKSFGAKTGIAKRNLPMSEIRSLFTQLTFWRTREANRRLVKFTLACGQRISTILEMKRDELDVDSGTWLIPKTSVSRKTKSKDARLLPLSRYMTSLLNAQLEEIPADSELVWPATNGRVMFPASVRRCLEDNLTDMEPFSPHDLRRTLISRLHERAARLGVNAADIERLVGHVLPGMMAVYAHADPDDPLRGQCDVLNAWGSLLSGIDYTRVRAITERWNHDRGALRRVPLI